jgi:RsiW-degrading membrane proteinase PrsW (M82 family)
MSRTDTRPITRDDIEAKMREIQGGTEAGADAARGAGLAAVVGALLLAVIVAYLLGRRKGKKRRTMVEIRRV